MVRLSKVCRLWRDVGASPSLWRKVDLNAVKERARTDYRLSWLVLHKLPLCEDLNLGEWKVRDIQATLEEITHNCPHLRGLNLSGWKGLNADNLKYITTECANLQRLDLSSINVSVWLPISFNTLFILYCFSLLLRLMRNLWCHSDKL